VNITNSLSRIYSNKLTTSKVVYPELSYKLVGAAFKVFNKLGFGFEEKIYQQALECELKMLGLEFTREAYSRVKYEGKTVGRHFLDFIVERKIVLELKVGTGLYNNHVRQIFSYLNDSKMSLGILIMFTPKGVLVKRIVR